MTKHCAALQREGNKKVTGGRRSADHDDHDNDNLSCDEAALKGHNKITTQGMNVKRNYYYLPSIHFD